MKLYWLDLETTGLDPNETTILEIAIAEADLSDPFNYRHIYNSVIGFPESDHKDLTPFILDMHTKNGLLIECVNEKKMISDVQEDLLDLIPHSETKADKPTLAGSSVHFDHSYLTVHMPKLAKRLSHRHYDVSAVKLFCHSVGMPELPPAEPAHRAKADIEYSIKLAGICRDWLRDNLKK